MNIPQELKGWSDAVLRTLNEEEDLSAEFRQAVRDEITARPHGFITLTSELLHSAATAGCGWNYKQLAVLGIKKPKKGWLSKLVGTEITTETWRQFVRLGKKA